ncbi:MAG: xylose isomerase, partial [Candidatus Latescibacterota bacterium]
MPDRSAPKPRLRLCAAAWTMAGTPSPRRPWSIDTKVRKAKEAGFEGFAAGAQPEVAAAVRRHGLELIGGVDVGRARDAGPRMKAFADAGATHVNVQLCDHDTPTDRALPVARAVMRAGARYGVEPAIEWHRDTCTETPEKGLALAAAYERRYGEQLRTNFDHSHPAVVKQVRPADYAARLLYRPDLLQLSRLLHLRTFTGSHCQTPVTDGRGRL